MQLDLARLRVHGNREAGLGPECHDAAVGQGDGTDFRNGRFEMLGAGIEKAEGNDLQHNKDQSRERQGAAGEAQGPWTPADMAPSNETFAQQGPKGDRREGCMVQRAHLTPQADRTLIGFAVPRVGGQPAREAPSIVARHITGFDPGVPFVRGDSDRLRGFRCRLHG